MTKPGLDLILGSITLELFGIVLYFWQKEITLDDISLLMRDFIKLQTKATIKRAWTMNNSIYQSKSKETQSTIKATKHLMQILHAKDEKVDLRKS